ncbi:hypothetical protein VTK56DRAFT_8116 [Thermocarpiscus australiensis]
MEKERSSCADLRSQISCTAIPRNPCDAKYDARSSPGLRRPSVELLAAISGKEHRNAASVRCSPSVARFLGNQGRRHSAPRRNARRRSEGSSVGPGSVSWSEAPAGWGWASFAGRLKDSDADWLGRCRSSSSDPGTAIGSSCGGNAGAQDEHGGHASLMLAVICSSMPGHDIEQGGNAALAAGGWDT